MLPDFGNNITFVGRSSGFHLIPAVRDIFDNEKKNQSAFT
jgi:hypothetical protein